jgi:hypothetical protein
MRSPVLFLVFNRPDTTRQVFEAIRMARPPKLYVAADGPRVNRTGEAQACIEVRNISSAVDWPCEVRTLYREHNLGCKNGVSSAISWFFSHEPEGIILEDDVLPISTFFAFCDELLERYRNDDRVSMITGCNLIDKDFHANDSYFLSYYCNIWGWASWRRVWRHYDVVMTKWPVWRDGGGLAKISSRRFLFEPYWRSVFNKAYEGKIDTWDYQWTFTCWQLGGLTILPAVNQIRNIGFGANATHTTTSAPKFVHELRTQPLKFPLRHPAIVKRYLRADALIGSKIFGINAIGALVRSLWKIPMFRTAISSVKILVRNAAG